MSNIEKKSASEKKIAIEKPSPSPEEYLESLKEVGNRTYYRKLFIKENNQYAHNWIKENDKKWLEDYENNHQCGKIYKH